MHASIHPSIHPSCPASPPSPPSQHSSFHPPSSPLPCPAAPLHLSRSSLRSLLFPSPGLSYYKRSASDHSPPCRSQTGEGVELAFQTLAQSALAAQAGLEREKARHSSTPPLSIRLDLPASSLLLSPSLPPTHPPATHQPSLLPPLLPQLLPPSLIPHPPPTLPQLTHFLAPFLPFPLSLPLPPSLPLSMCFVA